MKMPEISRKFAEYDLTHQMKRKTMVLLILIGIIALAVIAGVAFVNQPAFGRHPRGERLERILRSANYRDGAFRNRHLTPQLTSDRSRASVMLGFLFRRDPNLRPTEPIDAVYTDLRGVPADSDYLVWFGHSSYLLQIGGKRILVDPVFCKAAPLGFINAPFAGTAIYSPDDMPPIDYLVITHDHWDHLDHQTVTRLRERIGTVVCPLGVGEHFEYWGFDPKRLIEMDWDEETTTDDGFTFHCLPARHFSGRGPKANQTLWASFLLETPSTSVFMGGDGGYDTHFAEIGERFGGVDLAILENGQYNADWRYIHSMPDQIGVEARELKARRVLTVHHLKYALARHPWDEPLATELRMIREDSLDLLRPRIGEVVPFSHSER